MNPNTGEILAEASYPNFDLNDPRNLSLLYTKEQWDAMSEEDQVEAMNDLWRNFCVSDAYERGLLRNRLLWRPAWKQEH